MGGDRWRVLVVCTANRCRSVMAEALLRERLGASAQVRSAGLLADEAEADPHAVAAVAGLGVETQPQRGHRLTRADVAAADLIVGLSVHHVRDVIVLDRDAFAKSFSLAELVARGRSLGPRPAEESLGSWLDRVHDGRLTSDLMATGSPFDIADPTGGSPQDYSRAAGRIAALVDELAGLLRVPALPVTTSDTSRRPASQPTGEDPPAAPSRAVVVADVASATVARQLAARAALEADDRPTGGWEHAGRRAQELAQAEPGLVVLCLSLEPHGAAMVANRHPVARAVVVTNAGMVTRARRRLSANVLCASSSLEPSTLLSIAVAAAIIPATDTDSG